jgi:hypothetical protein
MKTQSILRPLVTLTIISLLLAGCTLPFMQEKPSSAGWLDWNGTHRWSESGDDSDGFVALSGEAGSIDESITAKEVAPPVEELSGSDRETGTLPTAPGKGLANNQNSNLRAGSVDDNEQWDDYLLYRLHFADWGIPVHEIDISERHQFQVTNSDGLPVLGAHLTIADDRGHQLASLHTHANGEALFFPLASANPETQEFFVMVEKGNQSTEYHISREEREHSLILDAPSTAKPIRLDIEFLIDVTGSMSDEIQQLKDNMIQIAEQISELPSQPNVRFGMTVYRDRSDVFVSRTFDFTSDVESFTEELRKVQADGGDDYPESLNEGLHKALYLPEWRIEDTVSLTFLVADAPPHLDYANDYDYAEDVFIAAEKGIKIIPIASSGLNDQGEYIFRQLAQITSGKFLFLTYGAGGAPGDETTHHVDDYSVLSLDQLVVRIVTEELAALSPSQ